MLRRLVLPTMTSGSWSRLISKELQGIRYPHGQTGNAELTMELRALRGGSTKIVVTEQPEYVLDSGREFTVNHP